MLFRSYTICFPVTIALGGKGKKLKEITDRVIASEIRNASLLLIKRETNLRKLWATDSIFTTIPCLEMVEVPISECSDYVDDCTIARSKFKIPRIAEGNY